MPRRSIVAAPCVPLLTFWPSLGAVTGNKRYAAMPDVPTLKEAGLNVSAIVGYVTIKYFLRFLARHRLDVFAWYRLALAALTVVWLWRH